MSTSTCNITNEEHALVSMTTEEIVSYLNAKYADKHFSISSKEDCGIDDESASEALICFAEGDMDIINPSFSSCSRFPVDSLQTYGIDKKDAELINIHNKLNM